MDLIVHDPSRLGSAVEEFQHLALALESIGEGVDITAPDDRIRYVNSACAKMYGYTREELIGQSASVFVPTDQVFVDDDAICSAPGGKWEGEVVRVKKNGERFFEYLTLTHVRDDEGQVIGRMAVHRNITDRRRAQEEVQRLSRENQVLARISQVIDSSSNIGDVYDQLARLVRALIPFDRMIINQIDRDHKIFDTVYASGVDQPEGAAWRRTPMAGTFVEGVIGAGTGLLFQAARVDEVASSYPGLLPGFEAGFRSFIGTPLMSHDCPIGTLHFNSRMPQAYTDRDVAIAERVGAQIAGAIASAQLQSERKELQDQLFRYQKMEALGRLAGGVAHDFNNLLTPIIAFSGLGRSLVSPTSRLSGYLHEIQKAGERAGQLARQLLAFSRHQMIEPQVANLNDLIMKVDRMLRRIIGEHIELIFLPGQDLGPVSVDFAQLEQVLINLVVNSRDALPGGGRIIIETGNVVLDDEYARLHSHVDAGDYVLLSVTDTGSGIHEEAIEHIFEPFYTTKEAGQGTGLGLSTSYGTVSQLGGHITVESEPGRGAKFKVYLPRVEQSSSVEGVIQRPSQLPGGTETVMVVEDESVVLSVACEVLRVQGYTVLEASNGYQALWLAQEHSDDRIDLLLTDLVMPLMGGKELSVQFKVEHPETKVLYFSGYSDDTSLGQVGPDERISLLEKPFTPASLAQMVRKALDDSVTTQPG